MIRDEVARKYLYDLPFHVEVDTAVMTLELEAGFMLTPEDKSLATHAAAYALHMRGRLPYK